jgi:hypothetical protein
LSAKGDRVAVSAVYNDRSEIHGSAPKNAGYVRIFDYNETDWTPVGQGM